MTVVRAFLVGGFDLPLVAPVAGSTPARREGCWVRLETTDGTFGLGEASPAPWVGGESLADTRRDLDGVAARAPGRNSDDLRSEVETLSPAAAFAVECAIFDLEARRRGVSMARYLGAPADLSQPVAALLAGDEPEEIAVAARRAVGRGHACLKLKIGDRSPMADAARVAAARRGGAHGVAIRLDANRKLDGEAASELLERVRPLAVELVEEPLRAPTPATLASLRRLGVPIALDETIASVADFDRFAGALDLVVLKLARVGGFRAAVEIARRAAEEGCGVVVTDSIETTIGRSAALHAATAIAAIAGGRPLGLGGASHLAGDLARPRVPWMPALGVVAGPGLGVTLAEAT